MRNISRGYAGRGDYRCPNQAAYKQKNLRSAGKHNRTGKEGSCGGNDGGKKAYKKTQKGRFISSVFKIKRKKRDDGVKLDYFTLIKRTAEIFNPESESPWLEVSERELFDFIRSAAESIRQVLDATGLPFLKRLSLASATDAALFAKRTLGQSVVKTARRTFAVAISIVNLINPFFWIRRSVSAFVVFGICDEAVYASIEITAYKFAELYKNSSDHAGNSHKTYESA